MFDLFRKKSRYQGVIDPVVGLLKLQIDLSNAERLIVKLHVARSNVNSFDSKTSEGSYSYDSFMTGRDSFVTGYIFGLAKVALFNNPFDTDDLITLKAQEEIYIAIFGAVLDDGAARERYDVVTRDLWKDREDGYYYAEGVELGEKEMSDLIAFEKDVPMGLFDCLVRESLQPLKRKYMTLEEHLKMREREKTKPQLRIVGTEPDRG